MVAEEKVRTTKIKERKTVENNLKTKAKATRRQRNGSAENVGKKGTKRHSAQSDRTLNLA